MALCMLLAGVEHVLVSDRTNCTTLLFRKVERRCTSDSIVTLIIQSLRMLMTVIWGADEA